ncbi:unnamed protein product [Cochlearia groenlandica]
MLDTMGPELQVINKSEKAIFLKVDGLVTLTPCQDQEASSELFSINFAGLAKAVQKGDTIFVGQYLFTGSETASVWLEVNEVKGDDVICVSRNDATLAGPLFTLHASQVQIDLPTLAEKDKEIGVMIMTHGDDKGLVLPPKVASVQVVVIPVPYKDANTQGIFDACIAIVSALSEAGIRAEEDLRDNYSPGWNYSDWEMKGVPLRIEIGPRDLENNQVRTVRRDNGAKEDIPRDSLVEHVKELLEKIQQNMYEVAKQKRKHVL